MLDGQLLLNSCIRSVRTGGAARRGEPSWSQPEANKVRAKIGVFGGRYVSRGLTQKDRVMGFGCFLVSWMTFCLKTIELYPNLGVP